MGHVDVISRAAALSDQVVVAVMHNPAKRGPVGREERIKPPDAALVGVPAGRT